MLMLQVALPAACQQNMMFMGARANGMGLSSSCLSDPWAIWNNIAGLADLENPQVATSYLLHPGISSFNTMAALYAQPLNTGALGIGVSRFGDELFHQQILTAGYSNSFGIASLGVKLNYIQYAAEGFGSKGVASVSFGGLAHLTPALDVGAHIINLTQPKLTEYEKLPTTFVLGIAFNPTDYLIVSAEIEKDIDTDPRWKAGIEYTVYKRFFLRTGFNLQPRAGFFGFGYKSRQALKLDYAFSFSATLNQVHQATIGYHFKGKSK